MLKKHTITYITSLLFYLLIVLNSCTQSPKNDTTIEPTAAAPSDALFELLPASKTGIHFNNKITEDLAINYLTYDGVYQGAGVAIGDINNDGLEDIYFSGNQVANKLYLNKGNMQFEDITQKAKVGNTNGWSAGVTMVDINNDGYLDIYVSRFLFDEAEKNHNLLYINNGKGIFSEEAQKYGIAGADISVHANFFDYDNDGDLDLYVVNQPPNKIATRKQYQHKINYRFTDRFYRNNGNNTFTEVTKEAGIENYAYGLSATIGDFNQDGWQDIYIACDYEEPDLLYQNNGNGTFSNIANTALRHMSNFSMGSDVADFNNDGYLDIVTVDMVSEDHFRNKVNMGGMNPEKFWKLANAGYHYQYMFNMLQINNGNGTFSDVAQMAGVSKTDWSWACLFADFDLDGHKDLHITNGLKRDMRNNDYLLKRQAFIDQRLAEAKAQGNMNYTFDPIELINLAPSHKLQNYMYQNTGQLKFKKAQKKWGLHQAAFSHGAAYADLDNDGDLDLVVNNMEELAFVYLNKAVQQKQNNYLAFNFEGSAANKKAIGAKVKLYFNDGSLQYAEHSASRGYMSAVGHGLHFGLGKQTKVAEVIVTWPDGKSQTLQDVKSNQTITLQYNKANNLGKIIANKKGKPLLKDISKISGINFKHAENTYDDYAKEILLPHRMSQLGPFTAVGDVNGDQQEDLFIGGAKGQSGQLFLQQSRAKFVAATQQPWKTATNSEDMGATFFDADGDKDLDLYVSSGGNEVAPNDPLLQDRLYLNDGKGNFTFAATALPQMYSSSSCVKAGDYDKDGDLDLFVGGRQSPQKYPFPGKSYLLQNDGGKFTDVSNKVTNGLQNIGMVTDALWSDFDHNGSLDLVIVGEWMPLSFFSNESGKLVDVSKKTGLTASTGWWNTIIAADIDADGDTDYIAGNLGHNIKFKASATAPFNVYCHDFDKTGSYDIVLSYNNSGKEFPVRGRQCSSEQMPNIQSKFPTYGDFANATITDMYKNSGLDQALHYAADQFASCYIENKGNGQFTLHELPKIAQIAPTKGIIAHDFTGDGKTDLLLAGNNYQREIETVRSDAGIGLLLAGDGKGNFKHTPINDSGFFAPGDVRSLNLVQTNIANKPLIIVSNNNTIVQTFDWN